MPVLSGLEVSKFCASFTKVNPNGVDLAPKDVKLIPANATIYLHGEKRGYLAAKAAGRRRKSRRAAVEDAKEPLQPDDAGFYRFAKGGLYELRFPRVSIPSDCTGFAFPRSTVNRLGIVKLESAVFDSGYTGEFTQTIFTPIKAMVHREEALIQLVFIRNEAPAQMLYAGRYQNESSR